MQRVLKRNILTALFVTVIALFAAAPAGLAQNQGYQHQYAYQRHYYYYGYDHHSKLKGALIGGAGGAFVGGLAGGGKGALIGGGAGAGAGYLVQKYRNYRERRYYYYGHH